MGRICNLLLMGSGIWDLEVWCVTSEMSQRARASLLQLFCQRLVPAPGCCILRVPLQCRVQLQYTLRSGPLVRLRAPPSPSSLAPLHSTDEIHSRRRQIFDYSQHHHTVARLEEKKNRLPVLHLAMVQYKTWPGRLWRLARHTSPDSTSHISMHVTTLCKTIPSHAELGLR